MALYRAQRGVLAILWAPEMDGISWRLLASSEGFYCMEVVILDV
jgi:hypothetical protein